MSTTRSTTDAADGAGRSGTARTGGRQPRQQRARPPTPITRSWSAPSGGDDDRVGLDVIDHGPGLSDDQREAAFRPFHRFEDRGSTLRDRSRAADLCRLLRGDGSGADLDHHARRRTHRSRRVGGRAMTYVLVVEDDPALRRSLTLNLTARGYTVDETGNGEDALRLAGPPLARRDVRRPRAAGHLRPRRHHGRARLGRHPDHRALGARGRARQGRGARCRGHRLRHEAVRDRGADGATARRRADPCRATTRRTGRP